MSMDDDDPRWAEANALLSGSGDTAVLQRTRRRRTRTWLLVVAGTVTVTALAVLTGYLVGSHHHADPAQASTSDPVWVDVVSVACIVLGLLAMVLGFVRMWRAGLWRGRWRAPTSVLTRSQRRDLRRQVLGQAPVDPRRLPLLRDLADRMTKQNSLLLGFAGLMILQIGSLVSSPHLWRAVFVVALGLLYLTATVQIRRDGRRAGAFLARHPAHS